MHVKKGRLAKLAALLWVVLITHDSNGVTLVYNLKVTEGPRFESHKANFTGPSIGILIFFDQQLWRYDSVRERVNAGLGTYFYMTKHLTFKIDFAVGHVGQTKLDAPYFSRTQTDDILLTFGYKALEAERARIIISGKLGIPTHHNLITQGIQFGVAHVGLGAQLDGVFALTKNQLHTIQTALRYIRFFPNTIFFPNIKQPYTFNPGNAIDILVSYSGGTKKDRFEFGYGASFVFNPTIYPFIDTPLSNKSLGIRSAFFGTFGHGFSINKHRSGIVLGFSYGFDNKPLIFKRIVSIFGGWGINF